VSTNNFFLFRSFIKANWVKCRWNFPGLMFQLNLKGAPRGRPLLRRSPSQWWNLCGVVDVFAGSGDWIKVRSRASSDAIQASSGPLHLLGFLFSCNFIILNFIKWSACW
jgi:hypothetical protein